ncbi:MAG: T9SS type A sorting domain-containing protein [Bacteroidetes bacterium]|nr:T9SS type A sorting domain-containing protein [Bacteroidota bacterium]
MKKQLLLNISLLICLLSVASVTNFVSAQITYTEGFESTTFLPTGWTAVGTTNLWSRRLTGTFPTCLPHTDTAMARFASRNAQPSTIQTISTPVIDYSARGVSTPAVSFWIFRDDGAPTVLDMITLFVNSTPDLNGATQLGMVARSRQLNYPDTAATNGWYQYSFPIPSGFSSNTNYILFRGSSGSTQGNNIFIDDVQWDAYPTACSGTPTPGTISALDTIICGGSGSTLLSLNGQTTDMGISYQWKYSSSATGPWTDFGTSVANISTGTITATTYYYCLLTCSNSGLSDSTAVIQVTVDANPVPVLTLSESNNGNACAGQPVEIIATGATYYSWSPATGLNTTTGDTVLASPAGNPGTFVMYTVTGTNGSGCSARDSIGVTVHSTSTVTIQANPNDTICSGQQVTLNANPAGGQPAITSYLWTPTGDATQSTTDTPTADGTYTVNVVNNWGCPYTDSIRIHVITGSIPSITSISASNNALYCTGGDSIMLVVNATGAITYTWSPANGLNTTTGDTVYSTPTGGGPGGGSVLYTVTATNAGGCSASDTIRVRRANSPNVTMTVNPGDSICAGDSLIIQTQVGGFGGNYSYLWSPSGDTTTSQHLLPSTGSTIILQVTNNNGGCQLHDTVHVSVFNQPTAAFSFSITGHTVHFTNNSTGAVSYFWDFGDGSFSVSTSPTYTFTSDSTYYVTLIANSGTCDPDTVVHAIVVSGIGELVSNEGISLTPNPAINQAVLQFFSNQPVVTLQIYNSLGEKIREKNIQTNGNREVKEVLDLSTYPSGIYMIHLNTGKNNIVRKLIKQ